MIHKLGLSLIYIDITKTMWKYNVLQGSTRINGNDLIITTMPSLFSFTLISQ